jgi:branched-subunit amino acid aminotransferase/4-amino-4-deoxychorismate lyase
MTVAYFNNRFIPYKENLIDSMDEGIFTTILVENKKIYFLEKHLVRLKKHAKALNIPIKSIHPKSLFQLIEKNNAQKGIWRLKITYTDNKRLITLQKEPLVKKSLKLTVDHEFKPSKNAKIKTLYYSKRLQLLNEVKKMGYDDCIVFDDSQNILETTIANIFWIKKDTFCYPDPKLPYLFGITLEIAIKLAKSLKLKIESYKFKLNQLEDASIFYCNSIKKIKAVEEIENITIQKNTKTHQDFIDLFSHFLL